MHCNSTRHHPHPDLRGVFNWNVKQIFVWVAAEYKTPQRTFNEVSIWDKIITDKEDALIDMKEIEAEYGIMEFNHKLKSKDEIKLTLLWDVMPIIGLLQTTAAGASETASFRLP
jgi:signal peptidase complex subunit 3